MKTTIPSDLRKLQLQIEAWRRTRKKQTVIPDHLRTAAIAMLDRYSAAMICRACLLHPRTLERSAVQASSEQY